MIALYCRAPELMLGLPFSFSVDMWSVGQTLLYLFKPDCMLNWSSYQNVSILHRNTHSHLECVLFVAECVVCPQMRHLIDLLGPPPDHLLNSGAFTDVYFKKESNGAGSSWTLKVRPCSSRGSAVGFPTACNRMHEWECTI